MSNLSAFIVANGPALAAAGAAALAAGVLVIIVLLLLPRKPVSDPAAEQRLLELNARLDAMGTSRVAFPSVRRRRKLGSVGSTRRSRNAGRRNRAVMDLTIALVTDLHFGPEARFARQAAQAHRPGAGARRAPSSSG